MRFLVIACLLLACTGRQSFAKERVWQDATVQDISSDTQDKGAVVMPLNGGLVGGRISVTTIWYTIETEHMTYVLAWTPLACVFGRERPQCRVLDLTLHGKTKISLDGSNAHILEDSGKDVKVPVVKKIAK